MIKNYVKIVLRSLFRNRIFSIINILGLTLSMSICLMIITFIKDQKSSDRFHPNKDRIVRVYTTDKDIGFAEVRGYATTPGSLAPYLLSNYPFIEDATRLRQFNRSVILNGEDIPLNGFYTEASFFNIFNYHLLEGNSRTALNEPYSIIISQETAYKFFGDTDPLNKTMTFEDLGDFTVTGVLQDPDRKAHFKFDALFSFPTLSSLENKGVIDTDLGNWESFKEYYTYILLRNKNDLRNFEEQLGEVALSIFPQPENERFGFKIQKLLKINLGINLWLSMPGTRKAFDIVFIPILATLIVFLACFNYVILSISHSLKRTREIGFRKVTGARRTQIIGLFLTEAFVVTFISIIAASLLIIWLIPVFNGLDIIENSDLQINIQQMKNPVLYIIFLFFAIGVSSIAGLFPALYLSSFQPANALKGISKIRGLSHQKVREILLGAQFAVSLIAIIFIMYSKRMHSYLMNFDYGIMTDNFVSVQIQDANYEVFRNEIITNSGIRSISFSDDVPIFGGQRAMDLRNDKMEEARSAFCYSVDPGFIDNFEIKIMAGRNFSDEFSTDTENSVIINQEAVRVFNLDSPNESIGKILRTSDGEDLIVVGVIKDFIYTYPDVPVSPLVLQYLPEDFKFINISYLPGRKDEIKLYLNDIWSRFDKVHDVKYIFFDDARQESNDAMKGIIRVFSWACGFIILIALFGLLGMTLYTTEMRIKEIGIRKVLGASITNVAYMLSKKYLMLILYSAVFAIPAAYFISGTFYQIFAFRPGLNLWVLPVSLIFILSLAMIIVSSQTVKAALTNPADTLKEE